MGLASDIKKHCDDIAAKLLAEGLTAYTFTKKKAKQLTKNVVAVTYVHKLIDGFSKDIKAAMRKKSKK
jgi:hypothetical protein